jgi:hypothetical protein
MRAVQATRLLAIQLVCHGLAVWDLLPQRNLVGEVSQLWWSRPHRRWQPVGPLLASPGLNRARSGVGAASADALH